MCVVAQIPPVPTGGGMVGAINTSPRAVGIATIPKPDPKIIGAPRIDTDDTPSAK